jgi:LmbE family N-acetylglucosaminyl deacetylase
MAVHAHPDDESISTGGVLALYGHAGIRTVLVTCTDGGCGDGPGGIKPMDEGFDREMVVALRQEELRRSCEILGVNHLETLGYSDSGMMGWPYNDLPGSFWSTPVDEAADRLADLMRRYEPQVVVTYNADGFYGHPDHIQAHRVTLAAAEATGIPAKLYFTAVPRTQMIDFANRLRELGVEPPSDGDEAEEAGPRAEWATPDEEVTTYVDVKDVAVDKFDSLAAHASQSDNLLFLQMGKDVFAEIMGTEAFVRAVDRTGAPVPEDDLFAGLR